MKKRTPVSSIMTSKMVTVNTNDDLRKVSDLMKKHHIRHIPVVSGDKLAGVISQTDVMRLSFGNLFDGQTEADEAIFDMLKIEQVMVHHPKTVSPNDTIRDVATYLAQAEFHALPVVDDNKLVGIVTTTDVIKYLIDQYD
ncbi:CBS domain-containing protein [Danxiaibacter flavus]|uniref:CBS domain-containing protein n=1 Tax=Danxiaibacter flavus TaxID=3049108 RepID=A0ABV3ZD51_9BACT|nr:CBS domain-containing protein [Chitinophagaceae bacterium DXS]